MGSTRSPSSSRGGRRRGCRRRRHRRRQGEGPPRRAEARFQPGAGLSAPCMPPRSPQAADQAAPASAARHPLPMRRHSAAPAAGSLRLKTRSAWDVSSPRRSPGRAACGARQVQTLHWEATRRAGGARQSCAAAGRLAARAGPALGLWRSVGCGAGGGVAGRPRIQIARTPLPLSINAITVFGHHQTVQARPDGGTSQPQASRWRRSAHTAPTAGRRPDCSAVASPTVPTSRARQQHHLIQALLMVAVTGPALVIMGTPR